MHDLLIFKHTALDADLNFLEQYEAIDLNLWCTKHVWCESCTVTVKKLGNLKSISSCHVLYALSHYIIWFSSPPACHAQTLLYGQAAPFIWCLAVLWEEETAGGEKNMSNIMTCTFLIISLTKPWSSSTASSGCVLK